MLIRTILSILFLVTSFATITAQESVSTKALSFGNPNGEYQIVAYYDLQCGSCVSFHKGLKKATERYPGKVYVVIRHFPLPMHDQAFMASTVVEAANRQGKGLEMVEVLLNNQQRWSPAERPCGEMASDPVLVPLLLGLGVDELSVAPPLVPPVKFIIRRLKLTEAKELSEFALSSESAAEILGRCQDLARTVAPSLFEGK